VEVQPFIWYGDISECVYDILNADCGEARTISPYDILQSGRTFGSLWRCMQRETVNISWILGQKDAYHLSGIDILKNMRISEIICKSNFTEAINYPCILILQIVCYKRWCFPNRWQCHLVHCSYGNSHHTLRKYFHGYQFYVSLMYFLVARIETYNS